MKAVIMAGGKGSRLASLLDEHTPKPMIKLGGLPLLEHQINCLKNNNIKEITISIGYRGSAIKDYFKSGDCFGVAIRYIEESFPLGTAGSLFYLKEFGEDVLLINGDIMFDIDIGRFIAYHKLKNGLATVLTHPNNHPYDSSIIVTNECGMVVKWMNKEESPTNYKNCVNAGIHILSHKLLDRLEVLKKVDLDREILKPLVDEGALYAYQSSEYVKDIGTEGRYKAVCGDFPKHLIQRKNLHNKQKAVFLDRDGTINVHNGFISSPSQIELIKDADSAIKLINENGYLAIVITNQPVIARGCCTAEELLEIHNKIETLLGSSGCYIDAFYYCPHHPDSGFANEIKSLKIRCDCRKPKPGLIFEAARAFNIDLSSSYMVGDQLTDVEAGINAGCTPVYIGESSIEGVACYKSLYEFAADRMI